MERIQKWLKTRVGLLVFFVVALVVAYIFASLAINSGALWQYLIALALFLSSLYSLVRLLWKVVNGD